MYDFKNQGQSDRSFLLTPSVTAKDLPIKNELSFFTSSSQRSPGPGEIKHLNTKKNNITSEKMNFDKG